MQQFSRFLWLGAAHSIISSHAVKSWSCIAVFPKFLPTKYICFRATRIVLAGTSARCPQKRASLR